MMIRESSSTFFVFIFLLLAALVPLSRVRSLDIVDLNDDGKVDVADFGILLSAWGRNDKPPPDMTHNGAVDVEDFGFLMSKWGGGTPTVNIATPAHGALVRTKDMTVEFSVANWTVGSKGSDHIHFHLDGSAEHLMFYNAPDNTVESNTTPGAIVKATWIAPNMVRINDLADGPHTLRAHLATSAHLPPGNPEADKTVSFTVNSAFTSPGNVRVESQTWWMPSCDHTHMTVELPWEQETSGVLNLNVRATTHLFDDNCQDEEMIIEDENGAVLTNVPLTPPLTCAQTTCAFNIPTAVNTNAFSCDGQHVLNVRIVSRYNQVDKDQYLSTSNEIPIFVNNGKPSCNPQTPRRSDTPYLVGHGFHQTTGYACAIITNAPLAPLTAPHTFYVRACDGSKNTSIPFDRQLHEFPATGPWQQQNPSNGLVVFSQDGNFQKPIAVTINPATLTPGNHWLTIQTIDPDLVKEAYDSNLHHVRSNARIHFTVPASVGQGGTPQVTVGTAVPSPAPQQAANPGTGLAGWSASGGTIAWIADGQLQAQGRVLASVTNPRSFVNGPPLAMDGTRITYVSGSGNADLFLYDLSSNISRAIASQAAFHESGPSISGSEVAFVETPVSGGHAKIAVINTVTGVRKTVSGAAAQPSSAPDIAAGYVVWADQRNGNGDIYLYDPGTSQEYRITPNTKEQREPSIDVANGKVYLVWADDRNGLCPPSDSNCSNGSDIFSCEYSPSTHTCQEQRATFTTRSGVGGSRFNFHARRFPVLDYPWVAFQDTRNGGANPDILL